MHKFADSNDPYYILLQFRVLLHDAALGKVSASINENLTTWNYIRVNIR